MEKLCRVLLLLLFFTTPMLQCRAQKFEIDTLQFYGTSAEQANLVILGDGYTERELNKFTRDARNFMEYLFSIPPFREYKKNFNVFVIKVPSPESGVKHPHSAPDCYLQNFPAAAPDNYFGTTFDYGGIHRLVVPVHYNKIALVLADNIPDFDQVVMLANTPQYGGSGGVYATATTNKASNEIALHELGHSFGGLADEYWAGENYAMEKPNMTQESDPGKIKWRNWFGPSTGIGIHLYSGTSWYKPTDKACKMELLGSSFCAVCSEAIVERLHTLISPVTTYSPDNRQPLLTTSQTPAFYLRVKNVKPSPNTFKSEWQVNGVPVARNQDSLKVIPSKLQEGPNNISVSIADTTSLIRDEVHLNNHRYTLNWQVDYSVILPVTLISLKAVATAGGVTLSWTTAAEVNNDRFEVERSTNGLDWHMVGMVRGHGNSHELQHYLFFDPSLSLDLYPTLYYRLKQADINGHFAYSPVQAVQLKPQRAQIRLLGNPVSEHLHFAASGLAPAPLSLGIYGLDGSSVLELPLTLDPQDPGIRVPVAHLPPGVYIYSLVQDNEILATGRFLKIKK